MLNNQRGTIVPFLAVALVIIILFAGFSLAVATSFLHRKAVYDAVDTALLSSLMVVEQKSKPTMFTEGYQGMGYTHYYFTQSSEYKEYIYIDTPRARSMFGQNLQANIVKNAKDAKLISWRYMAVYDNERYLDLIKSLPDLHTQNYSVTHWWEDEEGESHSWTEYFNYDGMYNPDSWWSAEYGGLLPLPAPWTEAAYEERKWRSRGIQGQDGPVPFPRWVEVTAQVTAEVPSPLGTLFGKGDRQTVNITAKAVREIENLE